MSNPIHRRAVGDTYSAFQVTIKKDGVAVDLTSKDVMFSMNDEDGNVVVAETATGVTVTDAANGEVEYDFQAADVDEAGNFYGYFHVYDTSPGTERDTYPPDGVLIVLYAGTTDRTPEETIDIIGAANEPLRTRTREGFVEERSIDELIKANQYTSEANNLPPWGIRVARTKPPDTLGGPYGS